MDILSDVKIFGDLTFPNSYRVNFETNNYPEFHTNADYFYFVNCRGWSSDVGAGVAAARFCVGGNLMIRSNSLTYSDMTKSAGVNFVVCGENEMHLQLYDNSTSFDLCQVAKKSTVTMTIPSGCNRFHLDFINVDNRDMPLFQAYINNKTVYFDYEIDGSCAIDGIRAIASMSNGFSTDTDVTFRVS